LQRSGLVDAALRMAVTLRGQLPEQVIFHADRGCQYTSAQLADTSRRARTGPVSRADRGVLGQRLLGIVLADPENRLRPAPLGHQSRSPTGRRRLDRGPLQPAPTTLRDRNGHPGRVRTRPDRSAGDCRMTPTPVPPPPTICRCSVPSRSSLLGPSALRGLHPDNPCTPATMAATDQPEHNEHPPSVRHQPPERVSTKRGEPQPASFSNRRDAGHELIR
jgi:hypothetical protein